MSASSAGQGRRAAKLQAADGVQQTEIQQYMERIKLKELFQGLLRHVITHQPDDPIAYFHEEISKIKKEVEENHIDIGSSTFLTTSKHI
eukprot:Em0001g1887a